MKTSRIVLVGVVSLVLVVFSLALAQTAVRAAEPNFYRLVVPHAPGSAADGHARLLSDRLAKVLGKPVVVENLPGAGIKASMKLCAPKDGYTIGLTTSNIMVTRAFTKMPYGLLKASRRSRLSRPIHFLVVNPAVPARNVKELISLAKSQPGKLNYASPRIGTVPHLVAELFCAEAGVKITHVPYKGGSQIITDVVGGHVEMTFLTVGQSAQLIKAGKFRALGVSSLKRSSTLPDVRQSPSPVPTSYIGWITVIGPRVCRNPLSEAEGAVLGVKLKEVRMPFVSSEVLRQKEPNVQGSFKYKTPSNRAKAE
jgi:tripartite-type tricarboxylate transporter receptor subunit TctC